MDIDPHTLGKWSHTLGIIFQYIPDLKICFYYKKVWESPFGADYSSLCSCLKLHSLSHIRAQRRRLICCDRIPWYGDRSEEWNSRIY